MISIIIPIYNVSAYLEKCVNSVISQIYTDTEIILVDDGSPDNCPNKSDEYALLDRRIITIHKPNGGLSSARNKGLDIASGDYVNFLDSDDYILPEMLKDMVENMEANNTDMCLCGNNRIDENGSILSVVSFQNSVLKRDEALELLVQGNVYFIIACAKLYKKRIFFGLRFAEGKIHEDEFIVHHVLSRCKNVSCLSNPYYQYLERSGSIIASKKKLNWFNYAEAYLDRVQFFKDTGESSFSARVLMQTIPLLLSIRTMFPIDDKKAKTEAERLRREIISNIKFADCSSLPMTSRISLFAYKISDSTYLVWRKVYDFSSKAVRKIILGK